MMGRDSLAEVALACSFEKKERRKKARKGKKGPEGEERKKKREMRHKRKEGERENREQTWWQNGQFSKRKIVLENLIHNNGLTKRKEKRKSE
jgi:hypothetical protein